MMSLILHDVAHCRAGDKGDTSILSVFPYDERLFPLLRRELTAERVRAHLSRHVHGDVVRFELPDLCALQFVCTGALGGGVTISLERDAHGKAMSSRLLSLAIETEEA